LASKRYDVIHSHEEGAFFGLVLSPIFRTPHLYDMHSSLPKQLREFKFCDRWLIVKTFELLEDWVLKTAHVVLTIGSDLEEHVRQKNVTAHLLRIENTANLDIPSRDGDSVAELGRRQGLNNRLPIVYTGNLERYQGLDLLFQSAGVVLTKYPEALFVIVGGKPDQIGRWQSEVRRQGLEDGVIFVGEVSLAETYSYHRLAEILVSPRLGGLSIPLKIYSYMRSGKPIVATKIAAHTRILTDETAVIVDPTSDAYAAGILKLIENPELGQRIGRQAQRQAEEEFSMENFLAKLNSAYLAIGLARPIRDQIVPDAGKDLIRSV
jgi:glycosyltransferase involved in cell wall biosynthesis